MSQFVLGVDIGGTHITAAVVDLSGREIVQATLARRPLDAGASSTQIISEWSKAILEASSKYKEALSHIGIAMPGPFDYEKGIALMQNQGKYDALYEANVKELLAQRLGVDTKALKFQNDAACFMLGEAFAGAAKSYGKAIGLTLGTGLGSTVFANGKALDADLWKMPFYESIAEEYLSSRWFVKRFYERTGIKADNVKCIVALLPEQPVVQEIFTEFGSNLALFLKQFAELEQPEVIVLGGNISKAYPLFSDSLRSSLVEHDILLPIKPAVLGEEAALLGAASLWSSFS